MESPECWRIRLCSNIVKQYPKLSFGTGPEKTTLLQILQLDPLILLTGDISTTAVAGPETQNCFMATVSSSIYLELLVSHSVSREGVHLIVEVRLQPTA